MTKADIAKVIHERLGNVSTRESLELTNLVLETMKETLGRGEKIKISGFGNFVPRDKHPRRGRNPQTGESITIEARRVLTFRPSQLLKKSMNPETDNE